MAEKSEDRTVRYAANDLDGLRVLLNVGEFPFGVVDKRCINIVWFLEKLKRVNMSPEHRKPIFNYMYAAMGHTGNGPMMDETIGYGEAACKQAASTASAGRMVAALAFQNAPQKLVDDIDPDTFIYLYRIYYAKNVRIRPSSETSPMLILDGDSDPAPDPQP